MHFSYAHIYLAKFFCTFFYDDEIEKKQKMVFDVFSSVLNGIIDFSTMYVRTSYFAEKYLNEIKNFGIEYVC